MDPERPDGGVGAEWARRPERSNMAMLRLMSWISLKLGRPAGRCVLHGITLYFLLFGAASRRASRNYLRRALGRPARWSDVYRHIFSFAATIHDRVYLLNNRFDLFDISVSGADEVFQALDQGQGALLMGAHLGSFEAIRAVGRREVQLPVAMAMYEENARKINDTLAAISKQAKAHIIPLGRVDSMLRLHEALDAGALVGVLADRSLDDESSAPATLFGEAVRLPNGPFRLAAVLRRPVIFMVGLYLGGNRYAIHFETLADFGRCGPGQRQEMMRQAQARYAALLEAYCRQAPWNWFNFYDFWPADAAQGKESK